jgi:4-hydroxybenzoate polyprenyltransferase
MLAQLLPGRDALFPVISAFCTGVAVFLLDRVKLRDELLDPADALAEPDRVALLCRRPVAIRWLAGVMLVAGTALGVAGVPIGWGPLSVIVAGATPLVGAAGVVFYAGRPRGDRARPKDRLFVKNAFVATGIVGLSGGLVLAPGLASGHETISPAVLFATGALAMRAFADAALCDLDDADADLAYATRTLPHLLGRDGTRRLALAVHLACAAALLLGPSSRAEASHAWGWSTVAVGVLLRMLPARRLRNAVDATLGVQAAALALLLGPA